MECSPYKLLLAIVNDPGWKVEGDVIRARLVVIRVRHELKKNRSESDPDFYLSLHPYSLTFVAGALSLSSSW
jgi:hypothetical protein